MTRFRADRVQARVSKGEMETAIRELEAALAAKQVGHFKCLIGARFTNSARKILTTVNDFIVRCDKKFDLRALYLEMNGFAINYDEWFFDLFAYSKFAEDPEDIEWLCDWELASDQFTLRGMKAVQREFQLYYESDMRWDRRCRAAKEIAMHLVLAQYLRLIQKALAVGRLAKPIPVLATAHDFDIIARFMP
ncbi:MAG: hypothetical protein JXB13_03120 [Phycisphaerae bacterium]|nr:hypothetical protein [Phycisphaerae bacterium]